MYGTTDEVRPGAKRLLRIGKETGGAYLGDEISQGDWASRHDRYATPLHGRLRDGQVVPMSWHCEDASINWSQLPQVREEWHDIVARLGDRFRIFDDWGMFAYTNGAFKPWGDYLTEIDVGSGSRSSTTSRGTRGWTASATSPPWRSRTAGRSAPATAPAARVRSTWCPRNSAEAGRS